MARLTEEMVFARTKQSDISSIKKLNCWGAELSDVSVLKKMPNVEVLAFSINKIRTLVDFAGCRRLRELYVRKNEILDLTEIRHLRHLPNLTNLWLDENPCTRHAEYRMTVLRNLPNLEKLDNVPVTREEVREAKLRGIHIPDSDDEGYPQQQQQYGQYQSARSCESSPEREPEFYRQGGQQGAREQGSDGSVEESSEPRSPLAPTGPASPRRVASPQEERYEHSAMTASHYEPRTMRVPVPLRPSLSAHCFQDFTVNHHWERYNALAHERFELYDRPEIVLFADWRSAADRGEAGADPGCRERRSGTVGERRFFQRRPDRSSNLLSAVMCLVNEMDYQSLEVAKMAIRCRMEELTDDVEGQVD